MKKFFVFLLVAVVAGFSFAADPAIAFSGNIDSGIRMDLSEDSSVMYAWSDTAGAPLRYNFRLDYSLDGNAGATINLRATSSGQSIGTSGRAIPYVNRGFVWVKSPDGKMKVRSGYLWDTDYESSNNAWDTLSVLEWVTSVDFFPAEGIQFGFVVPTPLDKTSDATDLFLDTTYGMNLSIPDFGRVSTMAQYGSVDANRSLNFGIDYTAVKGLTSRFEGDLQQVGIPDVGYYQLFQELGYNFNGIGPNIQFTETIQKTNALNTFTVNASVTGKVGKFAVLGGYKQNYDEDGMTTDQLRAWGTINPNAKSAIKVGAYLSGVADGNDYMLSPFINFNASF